MSGVVRDGHQRRARRPARLYEAADRADIRADRARDARHWYLNAGVGGGQRDGETNVPQRLRERRRAQRQHMVVQGVQPDGRGPGRMVRRQCVNGARSQLIQ